MSPWRIKSCGWKFRHEDGFTLVMNLTAESTLILVVCNDAAPVVIFRYSWYWSKYFSRMWYGARSHWIGTFWTPANEIELITALYSGVRRYSYIRFSDSRTHCNTVQLMPFPLFHPKMVVECDLANENQVCNDIDSHRDVSPSHESAHIRWCLFYIAPCQRIYSVPNYLARPGTG